MYGSVFTGSGAETEKSERKVYCIVDYVFLCCEISLLLRFHFPSNHSTPLFHSIPFHSIQRLSPLSLRVGTKKWNWNNGSGILGISIRMVLLDGAGLVIPC